MQTFVLGVIVGWLGHYTYVWFRRRTVFHTTSYSTNSGKTSYVSYTWPKHLTHSIGTLIFRKSEEVYVGKKRGKK